MGFWEKMARIDRRIIYLFIAVVVIVPILLQITLPVTVSPPVRMAYETIDALPESSVVMISIDYDAASMPELQPMLRAILHHCFSKNLRVLMIAQWALGVPLGIEALESVAKEYGKKYGVDYVNLGFRPGGMAQMVGMGKEIRDYFLTDYRGTPIDSLPMMRHIHNYQDIALLVGLEAGATGDMWVIYVGGRYRQDIILGVTAVIAPDAYPYLQAGQIKGLIGGLKGASEYEYLVGKPGLGMAGMTAQSCAHILIILFIIIGNIGYFMMRRRK